MTICVYGAGSIGCYIGGCLAATGSEVVFIGRERLARQIAGPGLTLTDYHGTEMRVPDPRYETDPDAAAEADLVLVTVKSAATAQAGAELAARIRPGTVVISFQNGLGNADVLRGLLPQATVLAGMTPFNVVAQGEGRFHCGTSGGLEVEFDPALEPFETAFYSAYLPILRRHDMRAVLAGKLLMNLNNAVNALSGLALRDELSRRDFRRCLALAQREALAAFSAAGTRPAKLTPLPPRWMPAVLGLPDAVFARVAARTLAIDPLARSSMQDDLDAGRPTEVDYLNGAVVALAAEHDLDAPVNARLTDLVHAAETGGRRDWPGPDLLAALRLSR